MKLRLFRKIFTKKSAIGELSIDGKYFCWTLEDMVRPEGSDKVWGETAIPYGNYQVKLTYSPKFKRITPEILNVPNFKYIRFHIGNFPRNTEGCVLVGEKIGFNKVLRSRKAFENLMAKLKGQDKIELEII